MHHPSKIPVFPLFTLVNVAFFSALAGQANAEEPAQHLLSSIREATGVPGMSAAVSQNGKIIWSGTAGFRDQNRANPVDRETKFRIASVSKLFTAALVLHAAENGLLELDTDIINYLPNWPDNGGARITLRHLAAHTSGIDHYGSSDRYDPTVSYDTLSDSIGIFGHKPLPNPPGEAYIYSSYGFALMGAVLETVTEQSFDENLKQKILGPAQLEHTVTENIDAIPENTSDLFQQNGNSISRKNQSHVLGATGILSTPSDLVRFANAYATGQLIDRKTVEMSWEPIFLNNGKPAGTRRFDLGFGWRIGLDWTGDTVYHHAGTTPGARSILSINPTRQTAVAFVSNAQWVSRIETTAELLATAATSPRKSQKDNCDIGAWDVAGKFVELNAAPPIEANEHGEIVIQKSDGICTGKLFPTGALANWLQNHGSKTDHIPMTLISGENKTTKVFAAATPWGAFPLQLSNSGNSITVSGDFAGRLISLSATDAIQSR